MGFFSNLIENKALKVFSRKAVEQFSSLSNDAAAMCLVHAVDIAAKLAVCDDADSRAMAAIILDPQSGSSNDCLYIYDVVLSIYTAADKSGNQMIKKLGSNGDAFKVRISSMIMGYRIIMFLLADRVKKVDPVVARAFYAKTTLCTESDTLIKALNGFREQLLLESKAGLFDGNQRFTMDDNDLAFYKASIEHWSLSGKLSLM